MKQGFYLLCLAAGLCLSLVFPWTAWGMEAPGRGGEGWHYYEGDHSWRYEDSDGKFYTGWLEYDGEWYWFDSTGRMQEGGFADLDGQRYYFFPNGHLVWNQYLDLKYYDEKGQNQEDKNIRVIGDQKPDQEDRDLLTDALYQIPRGWLAQFVQDGWEMMFYKKKAYFEAPDTNLGIYYVYHSTDTRYKKVKFTRVEDVLAAFGQYVGYVSGCLDEESQWMEAWWEDFSALQLVLEIPDYYAADGAFCFGKAFSGYLDSETRERMEKVSPRVCDMLEELLWSRESPGRQEEHRQKRQAEKRMRELEKEKLGQEEGFGPGYLK